MENQQEPQNPNVNAEQQMETFAEGKVAHAVEKASARDKPRKDDLKIDDFASDLDRKKEEQAEARREIKEQRQAGVDVHGSLGEGRLWNEDNRDV